jgi:hypothetical protein
LIAAIRQHWRTILVLSLLVLIGMVGAYSDLHIGHD